MAWGNKKKRELEYQKSGQAAALKVGDLGADDVYGTDEDDFKASWEVDTDDFEPDDAATEDAAIDALEVGSLEPFHQP